MQPEIQTLAQKNLVGKRSIMSFANNQTFELWRSFMPMRKEISNNLNADLISMQVYEDTNYFSNFNPDTTFEKWAAVEVTDFDKIPAELETYILPAGLYAVFIHQNIASTANQTFEYIFKTWLPASDYVLDHRPHFEILGEKYKNNDPSSEEEVWIPVKLKI